MSEELISLDYTNRRYSIKHVFKKDSYTTCLGFDYAYDTAKAVAEWSHQSPPDPAKIGTPEGYGEYLDIMSRGQIYASTTHSRCPAHLTPQLIGLEHRRIEVIDAYGETRRFNVGKSIGWFPCHLELYNKASYSGGCVTGAPFKSIRIIY